MRFVRTRGLVLFLGAIVVLGVAACSPFGGIGGPSAPCAVTNSAEAADALVQRIASQSSAQGSTVTVTANNQEVTSLMSQYLHQAKEEEGGQAIPLQDPVICFKTGSMSVFGKINGWGINSNALMNVTPIISGGRVNFQIQQIQLGPISAPPDMSTGISTLISNSFNRQFNRLNITEISLQENQMRLSGTVR